MPGAESYETAPAACRLLVDQLVDAGIEQPAESTTTPPTMPPSQPLQPLLVAVGDSVTSDHEARENLRPDGTGTGVWRTTCDDPATSWAEDLCVRSGFR